LKWLMVFISLLKYFQSDLGLFIVITAEEDELLVAELVHLVFLRYCACVCIGFQYCRVLVGWS